MNQSVWEKMDQVYEARSYDTDATYSDIDPAYLQGIQGVERLALEALRQAGIARRLSDLEILDYGCGNAKWMGRWLAWGANPAKLHGVDIRPSAIAHGLQSFPGLDLRVSIEGLPYPDGFFDVVSQNLVFSSMLEPHTRKAAAAEMVRVLAPDGLLLWYDLRFNNPKNPNVRRVGLAEIRQLLSPLAPVLEKRVVLAPPISRRVAPHSWFLSQCMETSFPMLRTSRFGAYRRPGKQS